MISYYRLSPSGELFDQTGHPSLSLADVRTLLENPYSLLSSYAVQVGRKLHGKPYSVFAWRSHQHLQLTDKGFLIYGPEGSRTLPPDAFWRHLPELVVDVELGSRDADALVGYYGYLGFELSRYLESYDHRPDAPPYPILVMDLFTRVLAICDEEVFYVELELEPAAGIEVRSDIEPVSRDGLQHSTDYSEYISDIETIIDHIKGGDIYQANYTQQFSLQFDRDLDTISLYKRIRSSQDLRHGAYLNYGDLHVMSLSPELFLEVNDGRVITRPIKGTRPRGTTIAEDGRYMKELMASVKDRAELSMIVDLLRNDLGKSALPTTVSVESHAVVESYENVHHLVSTVSSSISVGLEHSWRMLLRALPGGSISGVPKLRSLEIIEKLEGMCRGIYTGNIGFLGLGGDMEFNIAIRTAVIDQHSRTAVLNAGGGIVLDSSPRGEYVESLHKAKHLVNYLGHTFVGHVVMLNGSYHVADKVNTAVSEVGVFETILVEEGSPVRLTDHLARLRKGMKFYGLTCQLPTKVDIKKLLGLNLASHGSHRLNIYAYQGDNGPNVLVRIKPYETPSGEISLLLGDEQFDVPEAVRDGHKSLEYGAYRLATQRAISQGCWDSLLYDSDGTILEGGRSTLYFFHSGSWVTPAKNVVHGTGRQRLLERGKVRGGNINLGDLPEVTAVAVSNALLGLASVGSIRDSSGVIWKATDRSAINILTTETI